MRRRNPAFRVFALILGITGAVFLAVGIFMSIQNAGFMETAEKTTGIITEINITQGSNSRNRHRVYVEYSVDGHAYNEVYGYYHAGMRRGDTVDIYYSSENPRNIQSGNISVPGILFTGTGSCLLLLIAVIAAFLRRRRRRIQRLLETGTLVYVQLEEVIYNRSITVNGRSPFYITCRWRDNTTGTTHFLKSGNLWADPRPTLERRQITELRAYIDRDNPARHHIDTSILE